ncbi:MAG: NADH:ubiquinone oxidoreductase subunit 6 (subunit J) [Mariniflexile sp.]|jgi:NADH:ubiquinone oxidoreductase subunit 6 (subunit J)
MNLYKILKYLAYALGIIGAIFALLLMTTDSESMIDNMLIVTYIALFVVIALILVYVVKGILAGNIKKTLTTVGLFIGIILISYLVSSGSDLDLKQFNDKGMGITEGISKNVGAGLYAFYLLAIIAIGATLLSGVKKLFNK